MDLLQIWQILLRRRWIVIQAFLVVFLTVAVATFMMKPLYTTSATLYYKQMDSLASAFSSLLSDMGLESFKTVLTSGDEVNDKIVLAQTAPILEETIKRLQLRDDEGNLLTSTKLLKPGITSLVLPLSKVVVESVEDTNTFKVTAYANNPLTAQYIANTLADVYIEYTTKDMEKEAGSAQKFIDEQIAIVKRDYEKVLNQLAEYQKKEEVIDLSQEVQVAIAKMVELYSKKEEAIVQILETKSRIKILEEQIKKGMELSTSTRAITQNPQIEKLKNDLSALQVDLTTALTEKTENHPDVVTIKNKIAKVEEAIAAEMSIFQKTSPDMEKLEQDLSSFEADVAGIDRQINEYKKQILKLPEKSVQLAMLQLAVKAGEKIYATLLENQFNIGMLKTMSFSDINLIEPAVLPAVDKPDRPKTPINLAIGIILGILTGMVLAFFFEYLDDTLKTHEDVSKNTTLTFLGTVPHFKYLRTHLISEADPRSPIVEVYRTIRSSLQFATLDNPPKSILVTSAGPSEGKSTTAANLAISFAKEGKRTLIVDADLRKPKMNEKFNVSNAKGITTLLSKGNDIEKCIQATTIDNLFALTSGPIPPDPGKIIDSEKFKSLVNELSKSFDILILDSPPALVVNDAINLSKVADASILVLESNKITRVALQATIDLFKNARVVPVGIVLNKFRVERAGYYYRYYKNYYKESYS